MSKLKPLFTSDNQEWETPQEWVSRLREAFGEFDLDVCAARDNVAKKFFTREDDGLNMTKWEGKCFMNPPYDNASEWMRHASIYGEYGLPIVALVPARTDTKWWHDYTKRATAILFIKGRIKFDRPDKKRGSAPFPSVLVIWWPGGLQEEQAEVLSKYGILMERTK